MTATKSGGTEIGSNAEVVRKNESIVGYTPSKRSSIPVGKLIESGITSDNEEIDGIKKSMPQTPVQGRKVRHLNGKIVNQTTALESTA